MPATSEQLWGAIECLYNEDGTADKIQPAVIAKLLEFKMVESNALDLPQLTPYGAECRTVLLTGSGEVPELNEMAAMENQRRFGRGKAG